MSNANRVYRYFMIGAAGLAAIFAVINLSGGQPWEGWLLTLALAALGIGFRGYPSLKGFSYTVMIFAAVAASSCRHLEIETYTFEVLPDAVAAGDVVSCVAREFDWVTGRLQS